jgi:hypothetical protein
MTGRRSYSARRAIMGSTLAARRAGIALATSAATDSDRKAFR